MCFHPKCHIAAPVCSISAAQASHECVLRVRWLQTHLRAVKKRATHLCRIFSTSLLSIPQRGLNAKQPATLFKASRAALCEGV